MFESLERRAMLAAEKYLIRRGYEIEHVDDLGMIIVAWDEDDLVIADVSISGDTDGDFPAGRDRKSMERYALSWLSTHEVGPDFRVRLDSICMVVIGSDRAMIRHEIGAGRF